MRYVLIERESRSELQSAVEAWIDKGWTPQGGASCTVVPEDCYLDDHARCPSTRLMFHQSMIKPNAGHQILSEAK